jgi:hypothetical protein
MSTDELADGEQVPVPRRRGPAFGEAGPPPAAKTQEDAAGPLDPRTEALLALAIVITVMAAYGAFGYGLYALVTSFG